MPHRGEVVRKILDDLDVNKTHLAKKIGVHRDTINNWSKEPNLSFEKIRKIGNAIDYDFSRDFPDYPYSSPPGVEESSTPYEPEFITIEDCVEDRNRWRIKYYQLLEKYASLMEEHRNR